MFDGVGRRQDATKGLLVNIGQHSLNGYERNCLFRNNGDGTFTDVAYVNDADRVEDGRGLSVRHPALRFIGLQASALARIDLWFVFGNRLLPLALQFFGAAETIIGFPLLDQP